MGTGIGAKASPYAGRRARLAGAFAAAIALLALALLPGLARATGAGSDGARRGDDRSELRAPPDGPDHAAEPDGAADRPLDGPRAALGAQPGRPPRPLLGGPGDGRLHRPRAALRGPPVSLRPVDRRHPRAREATLAEGALAGPGAAHAELRTAGAAAPAPLPGRLRPRHDAGRRALRVHPAALLRQRRRRRPQPPCTRGRAGDHRRQQAERADQAGQEPAQRRPRSARESRRTRLRAHGLRHQRAAAQPAPQGRPHAARRWARAGRRPLRRGRFALRRPRARLCGARRRRARRRARPEGDVAEPRDPARGFAEGPAEPDQRDQLHPAGLAVHDPQGRRPRGPPRRSAASRAARRRCSSTSSSGRSRSASAAAAATACGCDRGRWSCAATRLRRARA